MGQYNVNMGGAFGAPSHPVNEPTRFEAKLQSLEPRPGLHTDGADVASLVRNEVVGGRPEVSRAPARHADLEAKRAIANRPGRPGEMAKEGVVYVVETDEVFGLWCRRMIEDCGHGVMHFGSIDSFLARVDDVKSQESRRCVLVGSDARSAGGKSLQDELATRGCSIPVVVIASFADELVTSLALRKGAFACMEKPVTDDRLYATVEGALAFDAARDMSRRRLAALRARLESLTTRERQVLDLVLVGELNKTIADILGISIKTVELHRARLMDKMQAKSVVQLVQVTSPLWLAPNRS